MCIWGLVTVLISVQSANLDFSLNYSNDNYIHPLMERQGYKIESLLLRYEWIIKNVEKWGSEIAAKTDMSLTS